MTDVLGLGIDVLFFIWLWMLSIRVSNIFNGYLSHNQMLASLIETQAEHKRQLNEISKRVPGSARHIDSQGPSLH